MEHMDHFGIVFDSPRGYAPGQTVTGQVVLRSNEPITARFLKICIHGAAHTKWSEGERRYRTNCEGKEESYTEIVHYSAEVDYVSGETIAWSARNGTEKLPSGHHVFPFAFPLPIECPPSFEGFHGHVRYSVRVELDRPWKFNKNEREDFKVIPNFDLNHLPLGNVPRMMKDVKDIGQIFKKGIVTITVTIPKAGYAPGEYLPITIDIDNASKRAATFVRAELHQHSHYNASKNHGLLCTHSSYHEHHKDESKRIAEARKSIKIAPKTAGREMLRMKIPKSPPTFTSPIISIEYCLSVRLDTLTTLNNTLHCEFDIIIGTVPITESIVEPTVTTFPSDPPVLERLDSQPPAYSTVVPSAPTDDTAGTSALPPSYEESMCVTKI